jgi:hypothetical protein
MMGLLNPLRTPAESLSRQHGSGTHHVHRQRTTQPKPAAATAAATWWNTTDVVTVIRDGATPDDTTTPGPAPARSTGANQA